MKRLQNKIYGKNRKKDKAAVAGVTWALIGRPTNLKSVHEIIEFLKEKQEVQWALDNLPDLNIKNVTVEQFENFVKLITPVKKYKAAQAYFIQQLSGGQDAERAKKFCRTKAWIDWILQNRDYLI